MAIPEVIENFVLELERELEIEFLREYATGVIVLKASRPAVAIALYFGENTGRVPLDVDRGFHIDLDQIINNPAKIWLRLRALLGKGQVLYGRQTVVARIDKRVTQCFLEEHHLQVALPGKYRYGLFYQGELVSVAVFSGGRRMREQATDYRSFELLRFCHKAGYRVVGGLSKLLKAFIHDFHPGDIMTYVDRDWAKVSNLHTLGFEEEGRTAPQAFWIVGKERHYLPKDTASYDEHIKQHSKGYLSYNSGSMKMVLRLESLPAPRNPGS